MKKKRLSVDERKTINDHQLASYFSSYDHFWRLNKLVFLRKLLEERESLKATYENFYGDGYFDYEDFLYQNLTNGILADAVSETVMYCEDYLSLLKFIREEQYFIKRTVSYSAGIVKNIASRLRSLTQDQVRILFFLPPKEITDANFEHTKQKFENDSQEVYSAGINRIIDYHGSIIRFFNRYQDTYNQYKHGLKICLKGVAGKLNNEAIQERKKELSAPLFILQNRSIKEAYSKGGIVIPNISPDVIRENISDMFEERNMLHFELLDNININYLIQIGVCISQLLRPLIANRFALIECCRTDNNYRKWQPTLPSKNTRRITQLEFAFYVPTDRKMPSIADYQVKL